LCTVQYQYLYSQNYKAQSNHKTNKQNKATEKTFIEKAVGTQLNKN